MLKCVKVKQSVKFYWINGSYTFCEYLALVFVRVDCRKTENGEVTNLVTTFVIETIRDKSKRKK